MSLLVGTAQGLYSVSLGPGSATARLAGLQARLINHVAAAVGGGGGGACSAAAAVPRLQTGDGQLHRMLGAEQVGEDASGLHLLRSASESADAAWTCERVWSGDARSCGIWATGSGGSGLHLAVGTEPADVFCSHDRGSTWSAGTNSFAALDSRPQWTFPPPPHQPHVLSLERLASGQLVAGVEVGGVLVSTDAAGSCWEERSTGLYVDVHRCARWGSMAQGLSLFRGCPLHPRAVQHPAPQHLSAYAHCWSAPTLSHHPRSCRVDPRDDSHWLAVTGAQCCSRGAGPCMQEGAAAALQRMQPEPLSLGVLQGGACTPRAMRGPAGSTAAPRPFAASTLLDWPSTRSARWVSAGALCAPACRGLTCAASRLSATQPPDLPPPCPRSGRVRSWSPPATARLAWACTCTTPPTPAAAGRRSQGWCLVGSVQAPRVAARQCPTLLAAWPCWAPPPGTCWGLPTARGGSGRCCAMCRRRSRAWRRPGRAPLPSCTEPSMSACCAVAVPSHVLHGV